MGVEDRDWFWEDRDKREKEYGGDFNLHSKKVSKQKKASPKRKPFSRKVDIEEENTVSNVVTLALGFLLYRSIKSGSFISALLSGNGFFNNPLCRILIPIGFTVLGIVLFAQAAKRRKVSDKGVLNVLALIVSMLIFTFMAVVSFWSIYIIFM